MTLLRSELSGHREPWGESATVEDAFDVPGKGVVASLARWIPGSSCRVRLKRHGVLFESIVQVEHFLGDHSQVAILFTELAASDLPRGTQIEIVTPE